MKTSLTAAVTLALLPAAAAMAFVPTVDGKMEAAAETIHADPVMQALYKDLQSKEAQDARFANHMEIVRIASHRPLAMKSAARPK